MRIAICGSMAFSREMLDAKKTLEGRGHSIVVPAGLEAFVEGAVQVEDKWRKLQFDAFKAYYNEIKQSDAILVMNYAKHGIENYVGGNTLIEMAFAHVLEKRIYLLHPIPAISYTDEMAAMKPTILHGHLDLL
ncbi:hypothetical protein HY639_03815 [Candidatus Woesearchaeota archaeon]|nr:hypothetical protein [Candidatus Woesearchaeota archaeon]